MCKLGLVVFVVIYHVVFITYVVVVIFLFSILYFWCFFSFYIYIYIELWNKSRRWYNIVCLRLFWNVEIKILRNWRQKQQKKKKTTEFVLDNKLRITKKKTRRNSQKRSAEETKKINTQSKFLYLIAAYTHTHKYRVLNNRKEKRKKRGRRDLSSCDLVCLCIYVWKKNSYAFLMKDQKRKEKKWIEGNK